jgi:tetratricopeptide (TPR) repeat protein
MRGVVVFSLLLLSSRPALGADRRAQEKAARKACLTGNYAKGVAILADLFVETRQAIYIFNQGRCYEQNRRYEDAIAQFEEFVRTADTNSAQNDVAEAEKHIAQCKAKLPQDRIDSPPLSPPPPTPVYTPPAQPARVPAAVASESDEVVSRPEAPPAPGERRWGLLTAGIVTSAVGAGGIAAGLIFNLKSNDAAKKIETQVGSYPASSKDEKNFKTYSWIGYGAGAACMVTGVVLIAVGAVRSSPASSTDVAVVPTLGQGQMGAMLRGSF